MKHWLLAVCIAASAMSMGCRGEPTTVSDKDTADDDADAGASPLPEHLVVPSGLDPDRPHKAPPPPSGEHRP